MTPPRNLLTQISTLLQGEGGKIAVAIALFSAVTLSCRADPALTETVRCMNRDSGTAWSIRFDYRRRMADSFAADISDLLISWHDSLHGGYYDFDRRTGALTVRYASSTGGYSLQYACRARPAR
jgi:hypothetical protein